MSLIRALYIPTYLIVGGFFYEITKNPFQTRNPHRKTDEQGYLRPQNPPTIPDHPSPLSILQKWQENAFKIKALSNDLKIRFENFKEDLGGIQLDVENYDTERMPPLAYIARDIKIATKRYIAYQDYVIICDTSLKTPWVVVEAITKDTINNVEHYHCENVKIGIDEMPENYYFGCRGYKIPLRIDYIEPGGPRLDPCEQYDCIFCKRTKLWKVFHTYIKFLALVNKIVYVVSGPLFLPRDPEAVDPDPRLVEGIPSHYFKVILIQNGPGNFRMECFIIPNTFDPFDAQECVKEGEKSIEGKKVEKGEKEEGELDTTDEEGLLDDATGGEPSAHQQPQQKTKIKPKEPQSLNLKDYIVSRGELQGRSRILFFRKIPNRVIKQCTPDEGFFQPPPQLSRPAHIMAGRGRGRGMPGLHFSRIQ